MAKRKTMDDVVAAEVEIDELTAKIGEQTQELDRKRLLLGQEFAKLSASDVTRSLAGLARFQREKIDPLDAKIKAIQTKVKRWAINRPVAEAAE